MLWLIHAMREKSRIRITKQYAADLPRVNVDPKQIQQVFLNLLLNAIQAMPEGGKIDIDTAVVGNAGSRGVRVRIGDDGCGMTPETLRRAVGPFFATKHRGTGLGLAIADQIMTSHRGRLEIESSPGKGTRITLSFPL